MIKFVSATVVLWSRSPTMSNHFIFGCGFLGYRLAKRLMAEGGRVSTITRSEAKAQRLHSEGIEATVVDPADWSAWASQLAGTTLASITICIGNDRQQGQDHTTIYLSATRAAMSLSRRQPSDSCPIQFVSTTGVYARASERDNCHSAAEVFRLPSETFDESAPLGPERPGAIASVACEELLKTECAVPYCSFRLAGIYSLERIPNLQQLKSGSPMVGSADGWLNLIHVEDAASILSYAVTRPPSWSVLNVCDGHPVRRRDFYGFLSESLRCPPPVFTEVGGRSSNQKYIDNRRLRTWYLAPWQFPSYREGLAGAT
ncbi:MAG: NAD-dependent epimerase/dehydratase family protein [Planctomycetaceae bacterium]|nr:NAD-dependent epimerase/dehydratase family protein [Planctomycetaceae bacterium]